MRSQRFNLPVRITRHARQRMAEREISESELWQLIETGSLRWADAQRGWLYQRFPGRLDNLLCAAFVIQNGVVIKTVMHHWQLEAP